MFHVNKQTQEFLKCMCNRNIALGCSQNDGYYLKNAIS